MRTLRRPYFERVRQSGRHVFMRREPKGCFVPLHAEIKVGTLVGVLRQAEVSTEEFIGVL